MKCKRCGGDFPHKRGTYCGECEPDARPGTEGAGETAEARFKLALVAYGDDPSEQRRFAEVLRLYRAATGEVVGTVYLNRGTKTWRVYDTLTEEQVAALLPPRSDIELLLVRHPDREGA